MRSLRSIGHSPWAFVPDAPGGSPAQAKEERATLLDAANDLSAAKTKELPKFVAELGKVRSLFKTIDRASPAAARIAKRLVEAEKALDELKPLPGLITGLLDKVVLSIRAAAAGIAIPDGEGGEGGGSVDTGPLLAQIKNVYAACAGVEEAIDGLLKATRTTLPMPPAARDSL